jgi:tetratricopeptide (TPR) repeat protein
VRIYHNRSLEILLSILLLLLVSSFVGCQKPPVINQFYAENSTIVYGEKVQLHWSINGADSISIKDEYGNMITITTSDNVCTMKPLKTTSYSIVASNNAGTDNKTVVVNVNNISIDWIKTGDLCVVQGNYAEALKAYKAAIELNPNNTKLYFKRGNVYYETGQYDLANADYTQAIELDPKDKELAKLAESVKQLVAPQKNSDMLPYSFRRSNGDQLYMRNQTYAKNPTWQELHSFLARDKTEIQPYNYSSQICGDLAVMLHDKAEMAGIKCGVVGVDFKDKTTGHAINIFKTTDFGPIFISSQELIYCNADRVCYLMIDKEYGEIPVAYAKSFDYSFYEKYLQANEDYEKQLVAYNIEVNNFNAYVKYGLYIDTPEYEKAKSWEKELQNKKSALEKMELDISSCQPSSTGIVDRFEIFW